MTKDPFAYLSNDEVNCPCQINFCGTPIKRPEEYLKELNPSPPANPPESVTFKILNRRVPQFIQSNPHSFHGHFYPLGESPSSTFPRFHPREDEDIDMSLPLRVAVKDDI